MRNLVQMFCLFLFDISFWLKWKFIFGRNIVELIQPSKCIILGDTRLQFIIYCWKHYHFPSLVCDYLVDKSKLCKYPVLLTTEYSYQKKSFNDNKIVFLWFLYSLLVDITIKNYHSSLFVWLHRQERRYKNFLNFISF